MKAFIFPGQGCQKEGMGKDLYAQFPKAKDLFERANDFLGFRITDVMFHGTEEELMETKNTQLSVFVYETILALCQDDVKPDCVAGHSLGEYAALVVAGVLSFEDTMGFVKYRGEVMQDAFIKRPGHMGVVIGIPDDDVLDVLNKIGDEAGENLYIVNYNGPGQVVITGSRQSIKKACKVFMAMGAKRAFALPIKAVGHSPNSAEEGKLLEEKLRKIKFNDALIPIYQVADGNPHIKASEILDNQIKLMTHPVQWTKVTYNMINDGVTDFYEIGTDDTLQKIVRHMNTDVHVTSILHSPCYEGIIHDYSDD